MKKVKVRMLVSIAGLSDPQYDLVDPSFQPGQVVDLHPVLAQHWCASGHAERVDESVSEVEAAVIAPPETATLPSPKPKRFSKR